MKQVVYGGKVDSTSTTNYRMDTDVKRPRRCSRVNGARIVSVCTTIDFYGRIKEWIFLSRYIAEGDCWIVAVLFKRRWYSG